MSRDYSCCYLFWLHVMLLPGLTTHQPQGATGSLWSGHSYTEETRASPITRPHPQKNQKRRGRRLADCGVGGEKALYSVQARWAGRKTCPSSVCYFLLAHPYLNCKGLNFMPGDPNLVRFPVKLGFILTPPSWLLLLEFLKV